MVGPIDMATSCLSMEEFALRAGHKVLGEVDDNIAEIVVDPQGILA
jgi:hypothetical protein